MEYFLAVFGMVMIVEGLPYFAFPDRMKSWIHKVAEMPDATLRKLGFALMLMGLVLIYAAKNS
jgi:uncharacterized protein YjeT (DUF2065 family)